MIEERQIKYRGWIITAEADKDGFEIYAVKAGKDSGPPMASFSAGPGKLDWGITLMEMSIDHRHEGIKENLKELRSFQRGKLVKKKGMSRGQSGVDYSAKAPRTDKKLSVGANVKPIDWDLVGKQMRKWLPW